MTRAPLNIVGAAAAAVAAGPLFMIGMGFAAWLGAPDRVVSLPFDVSSLVPVVTLGVAAMVVGAIVALPVTLIGTAAMTWLSVRNPGASLPIFWALAGASAFAVPSAALNMTWVEASPDRLIPFVFTGACCALICRRGLAEWPAGCPRST